MNPPIPQITEDYIAQLARELPIANARKKKRVAKKYAAVIDGVPFMVRPDEIFTHTNEDRVKDSIRQHLWNLFHDTVLDKHPYYNSENDDDYNEYWEAFYEADERFDEIIDEMTTNGRIRIEEVPQT